MFYAREGKGGRTIYFIILLQETNEQFRILLSAHAGGLEKLMRKVGPSIERARPFYVAKEEADDLQKKCLEAAVQFQRANGKSLTHSFQIKQKGSVVLPY